MQLTIFGIVFGFLYIPQSTSEIPKCCPQGYKLNQFLTCTQPNINSDPLEENRQTYYLRQPEPNNLDMCVSASSEEEKGNVTVTESGELELEFGGCDRHGMVVRCGISLDKDNLTQLFFNDEENKTSCSSGNCLAAPMCGGEENGTWSVISCPCHQNTCIRKCCPKGELFDDAVGICVANATVPDWAPPQGNLSEFVLLTNSFPVTCESPHLLKIPFDFNTLSRCFTASQQEHRDLFQIKQDGSVQVNKYKFSLGPEAYCGEHTVHETGVLILNNLLVCLPEQHPRPPKFDVYGVLLIVGGIFLVATIAVSCYLPELYGTFYHKVTICHNISLMIASFTWGISNLLPPLSYSTCVTLSLLIQFTFLSSFFWMNVMCIDIALAFKNLRSVYGPAVDKGWMTLLWYSLYAWGFPLILSGITAIMELHPTVPQFLPRPGFGCRTCGFNPETSSILVYFYGPIIFILVFNAVLFTMTLLKIRAVEKQTAILKTRGKQKNGHGHQSHPEMQKVLLFTKMFILMGLTWGTEVVGWWVGGPAVVWYLPDLINFLRAIFLFVLFVGKRSVLSSLRQKLFNGSNKDLSEIMGRRSKSLSSEPKDLAEMERRGRILARQITQTIRISRQSSQL